MAFAQYGKFVSSGPIVAICLFVALLACVTFAPALLRALGPLVFWPFGKRLMDPEPSAPDEPSDARLWGWVADAVMRRPATILTLTVWLCAPLVYVGLNVGVTHDFMADLAPDRVSVVGAEAVRTYYHQGTIAPMKVVAQLSDEVAASGGEDGEPLDLTSPDGRFVIAPLHSMLFDLDPVADVRSLYLPTGGDPKNRKFLGGAAIRDLAAAGSPITNETFVSHTPPTEGRVTQLAVLLGEDPFSKTARDQIPEVQAALAAFSSAGEIDGEPNPWRGATFEVVGVTPGMRDLEVVTGSDRTRIQVLTVTVVFLVLLAILRRPMACAYLILTVLVSYWVTLGATSLFFEWLYGDTFRGLDWKVPIFLFVILIAVGQDYNIYLVTRVFEEQRTHGLSDGLRRAIVLTGGIITSCGVIMAGTFISMATGTLRGMIELGFALALGVMLDTFFVRTVVVPCYFALIARQSPPPDPPVERADAAPPTARVDPPLGCDGVLIGWRDRWVFGAENRASALGADPRATFPGARLGPRRPARTNAPKHHGEASRCRRLATHPPRSHRRPQERRTHDRRSGRRGRRPRSVPPGRVRLCDERPAHAGHGRIRDDRGDPSDRRSDPDPRRHGRHPGEFAATLRGERGHPASQQAAQGAPDHGRGRRSDRRRQPDGGVTCDSTKNNSTR